MHYLPIVLSTAFIVAGVVGLGVLFSKSMLSSQGDAEDTTLPILDGSKRPSPQFAAALRAAKSGNPAAQLAVGRAYAAGNLVEKSFERAFDWYSTCSRNGDRTPSEVWAKLGDLYMTGRGIGRDEQRAVQSYKTGAAAGDAYAHYRYATSLQQGKGGLAVDDVAAFKHFQAAADGGFADAFAQLAGAYAAGRGVPRDVQRAVSFSEAFIARPDADPTAVDTVKTNLGLAYTGMTAQRVDGSNMARGVELLQEAAAHGFAPARKALEELDKREEILRLEALAKHEGGAARNADSNTDDDDGMLMF